MVDTWSISNDQRRSRICFSLSDCFHTLIHISTHCDLCYIHITIAHCDGSKVFLLNIFTTCCELGNCTDVCRFGRLSTCIGIYLSIKYHYVDIFATCKDMIYATESDIVSPSVTTEYPLGFLSKEVFLSKDFLSFVTTACL